MANQRITTEIIDAINRWRIEEQLTYENIGELIGGINKTTIHQWISGKSKSIQDTSFARLLPYIQKYLPAGYQPFENNQGIVYNHSTHVGDSMSGYCLSVAIKKITDTTELTAEEKIKVIKVLQS